jgi:hypothetical protein
MPLPSMYVLGPVLAFGAVLALAGALRWAFGRDLRQVPISRQPPDYGLLRPVAVVGDALTAYAVRQMLREADIRSTTVFSQDARLQVLVFEDDLDHARQVVN